MGEVMATPASQGSKAAPAPQPLKAVPPSTVGTIMTRRVVTASPDDTLATVRKMFRELEFHHLVVVERKRVIGLMSDRDLLRNLSPFIGRRTEREQDINCLNRKVHQVMSRHIVSCTESTSIA